MGRRYFCAPQYSDGSNAHSDQCLWQCMSLMQFFFFWHSITFNNIVFKHCIRQPDSCVQVGRQCQVNYIQQSFFFPGSCTLAFKQNLSCLDVSASVTSSRPTRSVSVILSCVIWTSLSHLSYYNGFRRTQRR